MDRDQPVSVLCIDDADMYGGELVNIIRELYSLSYNPLIVVALRSARVERRLGPKHRGDLPLKELTVPHLADSDIEKLIDVLKENSALGRLTGESRDSQVRAFREQAGRQLLVAMYQATRGGRFESKVAEEFDELDRVEQHLCAICAVATSFRFGLEASDVLTAYGDADNQVLNTLNHLTDRLLLVKVRRAGRDELEVRHRVIGELLTDHLASHGMLGDVVRGLALVAATKVTPQMRSSARPMRLLISVMNHDFLGRTVGVDRARMIYDELEGVLGHTPHYWLQRGSLELELGALDDAELFLNTAQSMDGTDGKIATEWAYLLLKKAVSNPTAPNSQSLWDDGEQRLIERINAGVNSEHPYHILGSQAIAWSRRGIPTGKEDERNRFLSRITEVVAKGARAFPTDGMKRLHRDMMAEHLGLRR